MPRFRNPLVFQDGSAQNTAYLGAQIGVLLALVKYDPASYTQQTITSSTMTALDSTNLAVTFTAPPSGNILVRLSALAGASASGLAGYWGVLEGATTIARATCGFFNASTGDIRTSVELVISGLTAGSSHTYLFAHQANSSGATFRTTYGDGSQGNPAVIEVFNFVSVASATYLPLTGGGVVTQTPGSLALGIKRSGSSETSHLQEWQDETTQPLLYIDATGVIQSKIAGTSTYVPLQAVNTYNSEVGYSVPELLLTQGRFDFNGQGGKAEIRLHTSSTNFDIYNVDNATTYLNASPTTLALSGSVTFGDSTIQTTAAVPLTGGTMTGQLVLPSSGVKYSDTTAQTTAGVPLTGGTMTGQLTLPSTGVKFSNGTTQTVAALPLTGGTLTGGLTVAAAGVTFSDATAQTTAYKALTSRSVSTSSTLVIGDANNVVESTAASAITITIPPNSSVAFPVNTVVEILQYAAGTVTVAAGTGVTLRNPSSVTTRTTYSTISIRQRAANEWVLSGDLT